jgi:hypothetical protein
MAAIMIQATTIDRGTLRSISHARSALTASTFLNSDRLDHSLLTPFFHIRSAGVSAIFNDAS